MPLTMIDEKALVRELAQKVKDEADSLRMKDIRKRWCDVNSLRKPDRAPVWCKPVSCWGELLPEEHLQCASPVLRQIERELRRTLIKIDIDDDTPIEPWWDVTAAFSRTPQNIWGVDIQHKKPEQTNGAWVYMPPLKEESDFDKLVAPSFKYDKEQTEQILGNINDILGDILPVRLTAPMPVSAILGTDAANLRGLETIMMDMIDEPELMHRLMAHIRDAVIDGLDAVEQAGLVVPNNFGPMTLSDPIMSNEEPVNWKHCWCSANSQEFDQVSPAMWEEFLLEYQKPVFSRFGAVAYGCCENLTQKIDGVLSIPNLRIFVCSAWSNLDKVLEKVGIKHTIMWRQKASDVIFARSDTPVRQHFESNLPKLQGHYYQIVMRELETLNGDCQRLHRWSAIAKELAAKYA